MKKEEEIVWWQVALGSLVILLCFMIAGDIYDGVNTNEVNKCLTIEKKPYTGMACPSFIRGYNKTNYENCLILVQNQSLVITS